MNCGVFQPALEAGAARPSVRGSDVLIEISGGFGTSIPTAAADQMWLKQWDARPAYAVNHTACPIQRPLERSP
jgi:hypothetical protein